MEEWHIEAGMNEVFGNLRFADKGLNDNKGETRHTISGSSRNVGKIPWK